MAALQHAILTVGVTLSAITTEGQIVTAAGAIAGAGLNGLGPVQSGGAIGARVGVTALGIGKCVAGAAIAVGALVEVGAAGKVITKAAGIAIGRALSAAGADLDEIEVFMIPQ